MTLTKPEPPAKYLCTLSSPAKNGFVSVGTISPKLGWVNHQRYKLFSGEPDAFDGVIHTHIVCRVPYTCDSGKQRYRNIGGGGGGTSPVAISTCSERVGKAAKLSLIPKIGQCNAQNVNEGCGLLEWQRKVTSASSLPRRVVGMSRTILLIFCINAKY